MNETREKEIHNAAIERCFAEWHNGNSAIIDVWKDGAKWADENPKSQYNISDTDYVVSMIESALTSAEHLTTGNLAHNKAIIMLQLREALKSINIKEK